MNTFEDFKSFNEYFGTEPPLNDHIDVGVYGDQYLMQSEAVALDYHRFSLKQRIHFPKNHSLRHLNDEKVSALFYSSPKDINPWFVEKRFAGFYVQFSKKIINENKHIFKKLMDFGQHEPLFLNREEEQEIEQIFRTMVSHYKANPENHEILLAYSLVLFSWVETLYLKQLKHQSEDFNKTVVAFQDLLNDYYENHTDKQVLLPSVTYFSSCLNITPNHLGDIIKKHTGLSTMEHIQNYIIKQAQLKLEHNHNSIKNIAIDLGYEYQTYFTRFFKSKVGVTPTQYRNSKMFQNKP